MNKIGFQNFRKFKVLNAIEYDGITFLVGRNNAGKSTLVKALLLIDNYFKSKNFQQLSFVNNILDEANIITYGRAKTQNAEKNQIDFYIEFGRYMIMLGVSGNDEQSFADVIHLVLYDNLSKFSFSFDMIANNLTISNQSLHTKAKANDLAFDLYVSNLKSIEEVLNKTEVKKTSKAYIELNTEKEKTINKIAELNRLRRATPEKNYSIESDFHNASSLKEIVESLIDYSKNEYHRIFNNIQNGNKAPENFEDLKAFDEYGMSNITDEVFNPLLVFLQNSSIVYIGANTTKQSALFAIRDKNNSLAQVIHDYKQLNILNAEEEHRFVVDWMKAFDIGNDFTIKMHAGEAYELKIHTSNGKIDIADKGMGSIQAMALIMKLACAIRRKKNLFKNTSSLQKETYGITTILIEEPELNLHPALQSQLADLFLDVHRKHDINFIVETHSEYLIRKTQLLVKENDFEILPNENPFNVIYFSDEKPPYKMNYRQDGKFIESFGSGFFDVSTNLTFELL